MKRILIFFAILAWSFGMLNAADVKIRLLIPTDSKFTTTGTIKIKAEDSYSSGLFFMGAFTREGTSRWWSTTLTLPDDMKFKYDISTETSVTTMDNTFLMKGEETHVAKETPELNLEILALYQEYGGNRYFAMGEVSATKEDHDYSISSWDVRDIGNGITISWTANNVAPYYVLGIMDDNNNDLIADAFKITNGEFTYHYNGAENVHIIQAFMYPCDYVSASDFTPYVELFMKAVDIYFTGKDAYTVYDGDSTLTYYYDGKRASHTGTGVVTELYEPEKGHNQQRFANYADKVKKAVIDPSFKDARLKSFANMFDGAKTGYELLNMHTIEGIENLNFSEVTDTYAMFAGCAALKNINLSKFNTEKVDTMQLMFFKCKALANLDVSSFNTANVKDMSKMFRECSSLQVLDLTHFDMSNVGNVAAMFNSCSSLKTIYCEGTWNNVTVSDWMFDGCTALQGGKGTAYAATKPADKTYARPDGGNTAPGYFTTLDMNDKAKLYAYIRDMRMLYNFAIQYVPETNPTLAGFKTQTLDKFEETYNTGTDAEISSSLSVADIYVGYAIDFMMDDGNGKGKAAIKDILDSKLMPGDNAQCQQIIADAKSKIDALEWDDNKSVEENIAILDPAIKKILADADAALAAARTATGIEEMSTVNCQLSTKKFFRNGQLYIERDGKLYNAAGAEVE